MDSRNLALSKFNKMNSQIFALIDQPKFGFIPFFTITVHILIDERLKASVTTMYHGQLWWENSTDQCLMRV